MVPASMAKRLATKKHVLGDEDDDDDDEEGQGQGKPVAPAEGKTAGRGTDRYPVTCWCWPRGAAVRVLMHLSSMLNTWLALSCTHGALTRVCSLDLLVRITWSGVRQYGGSFIKHLRPQAVMECVSIRFCLQQPDHCRARKRTLHPR